MGKRYYFFPFYCYLCIHPKCQIIPHFREYHIQVQSRFNFCRSRIYAGQTSIEPVPSFIWRAATIAVFLVCKVGRMETSFRSLPTICHIMFSFSGRHICLPSVEGTLCFPLVDLWTLYVFLYQSTYGPSLWTWFMHFIIKPSGFILSVSSSIPQRTSEYNSLPENCFQSG